jgi:hypothetical protein
MFYAEVHTARSFIEIRYIFREKSLAIAQKLFYTTEFVLNNFTLISQNLHSGVVQNNVTS